MELEELTRDLPATKPSSEKEQAASSAPQKRPNADSGDAQSRKKRKRRKEFFDFAA